MTFGALGHGGFHSPPTIPSPHRRRDRRAGCTHPKVKRGYCPGRSGDTQAGHRGQAHCPERNTASGYRGGCIRFHGRRTPRWSGVIIPAGLGAEAVVAEVFVWERQIHVGCTSAAVSGKE